MALERVHSREKVCRKGDGMDFYWVLEWGG